MGGNGLKLKAREIAVSVIWHEILHTWGQIVERGRKIDEEKKPRGLEREKDRE